LRVAEREGVVEKARAGVEVRLLRMGEDRMRRVVVDGRKAEVVNVDLVAGARRRLKNTPAMVCD
jgi:hypothetical protein